MRRRNTGSGSLYKRGRLWWIAWSQDGQRLKESTGTAVKAEAEAVLHRKLADRVAGVRATKGLPITVKELVGLVQADYEANKQKSAKRVAQSGAHLCRLLGSSTLASAVDERTVNAYVLQRQKDGAADATINRELACLRRAFRLAVRTRRIERRPDFTLLTERNARQGFFEEDQFRAVLSHLDDDLRPVVEVAYLTGWRVPSEILTRQRRHLDLKAGWLRLEPEETKNRRGRMFPLTAELRRVLAAQVKRTEAMEKEMGRPIPWLFHRAGHPIHYFRRAWLTACRLAGCPGKLPHDFRRTAVRNMERAGVPRSSGKALSGHITDSVYERYSIVDESMLLEAARLMEKKPRKR